MGDLNDIYRTDLVHDVLASGNTGYNKLLSSALYANYRNVETISATKELTDNDYQIQLITPSGSDQTVELPPEATTNHLFWISCASGSSFDVIIKDDSGATTFEALDAGETVLCLSNGSFWDTQKFGAAGGGAEVWQAYNSVIPTRASADNPTYVITFAAVDLTALVGVGMRVKWTQNGTVRYGIVMAISFSTNTTMTINGGTDYDVDDTATYPISDFAFSATKAPVGFPLNPDKWAVELTDTTNRDQATTVQFTWYNSGSLSFDLPIGSWNLWFRANAQLMDAGVYSINVAVSTSTSSVSDTELLSQFTGVGQFSMAAFTVQKPLTVASKTTLYIIQMNSSGTQGIRLANSAVPLILRAIPAYL